MERIAQTNNMGLPVLEKFCFCLELKTGTIIVGILNLICAIILSIVVGIALGVVSAASAPLFGNQDLAQLDDTLRQVYKKQGLEYTENLKGTAESAAAWMIAVYAITLFICIGYLVLASLLIHGARKGNPKLLLPWLIFTIFSLVWNAVQIIGNFVAGRWNLAISGIVGMIIGIYIMICIWSFRKQLLTENQRGVPKH